MSADQFVWIVVLEISALIGVLAIWAVLQDIRHEQKSKEGKR